MSDLICRKSMQRCQHPGMCSPHGGCQPEKSEWQSGYDEGRRMGVKTALDEREQLKSENEALRKDAERYRFLRNPIGTSSPLAIWSEGKMPLFSGMADAVVGEFMAKERGQ